MNRSIAPYIAVLSLLGAACRDDLTTTSAEWSTTTDGWQTRVDALVADQVAQGQKIDGWCATPGLDPGNVAAKTCAALKVTRTSEQANLEALVGAMARHLGAVDRAMGKGKLPDITPAKEAAKAELTALLGRVEGDALPRREAAKALEGAVTSEVEAAKVAALAASAKAELWRQASAERKPLELTDIRFTKGTAELEAGGQRQLDELTAWANGCPGLTFSITAHDSKERANAEAVELTGKRAAAVKRFLVDAGVVASRVVSVSGHGSSTPVADEPEPTSAAALAMNPDELETLRNKNRRITVQAVATCHPGLHAEWALP
jgi:outer membrane protein OmpA-like peptidoglycan-associated protein